MSTKTRRHNHPDHASNIEMNKGSAEKLSRTRQGVSDEERSRLIQVRAYSLWEQAGKPDGDASRERYWFEAEREIMAPHVSDQ